MTLRQDCEQIVRQAIAAVQPDEAVRRALEGRAFPAGRLVLVSVGKAAWSMAKAAWDCVGERLDSGIVITKHGHAQGPITSLRIREAGHPVPDEDTFSATEEALALTSGLTEADTVLFLSPAAVRPCLKPLWCPPRSSRTSPGSCWPAGRTLWK